MKQIPVKGFKLAWCCDRGRLFLIWVWLCGFDHQRSCDARRDQYFRQNCSRPSNSQGGIGYGGGAAQPQDHSKAEAAGARVDNLTEQVLAFLSVLLPTLKSGSDFDLSPPPDLLPMLVHSAILDKAAELLRNDSLEDATKRSGLYQSVLDFVQALGSHYATAEVAVHSERSIKPEGIDLLKLSFGSRLPISKGKGKDEKSQSIATCLRNLNTQSNIMLQNARANEEDFHTRDSQRMLWLCRQISDLADFLLANSRPADTSGVNMTAWELWQKENCLLDFPDAQILNGHYYAQEAARMCRPPKGRMKCLILDITNLKTGLPAGIFVRICSSRLDVMKVLIVGPGGSPYEGGLFEFDLLCPSNYPNEPPKMWFRTTGGGQAHFNPNLYPDGKGKSFGFSEF
jgi:baculoviral IAP repeat-containing protein 6